MGKQSKKASTRTSTGSPIQTIQNIGRIFLDIAFRIDFCIDPLHPENLLGHINLTLGRLAKPEDVEDYRKAETDAFGGGWDKIADYLKGYRDEYLVKAKLAGFTLGEAVGAYDAVETAFEAANNLSRVIVMPELTLEDRNRTLNVMSEHNGAFRKLETYLALIRANESKKGKSGRKITHFNLVIGPALEKMLPLGEPIPKRYKIAKEKYDYAEDRDQFKEDWTNYLENHSPKSRPQN